MKANYDLCIRSTKVALVPYREHHVELYHKWMQDPYLQEATASEPLTIEEEYAMQKSWAEDEKKCTFIILDRSLPDSEGTGAHGGGMAGDVNLFWNDYDDPNVAELELMVAEEGCRRKGLGREAAEVMMAYGAGRLGVTTFRVGYDNAPSLALFERLGFKEVSRAECFREVTMELPVVEGVKGKLEAASAALKTAPYDDADESGAR